MWFIKLLLKFCSVTLRALLLDDGTLSCNQIIIIIIFDLVQRLRISGAVSLSPPPIYIHGVALPLPLPF